MLTEELIAQQTQGLEEKEALQKEIALLRQELQRERKESAKTEGILDSTTEALQRCRKPLSGPQKVAQKTIKKPSPLCFGPVSLK